MTDMIGSDILEFIQAFHQARSAYEPYEQDVDTAPEPIRLLINTSKDLLDLLKEAEELFKRNNRPYPAQTVLIRRLDETEVFIRRYHGVRTQARESEGESWNSSVWTTAIGLFDKTRAKRYHETMMMECQKLIQFLLVVAL
jgi:phosphoglycolate phosphatase-like HAD superfamily hydrolase